MSISSEVRKAGPFAGNDVATAFPFAFKVFSTADVLVVEADALGAESTLDLGTDYTVSLNADQNASPGGTVTLSAALATGKKLVLSSQVAQLQPVDLTNSGGFYPDVINKALDRATILIQQLAEKVDRAIKVTLTSGLTPDEFVAELQQGASDAAASAAAAAASAAEAATFDPDLYQLKAYGAGTVEDALDGLIASGSAMTGMVAYFPRSTAPTGWLKANGAAISRTTYAALFAVIGTTFGAGDGSTTFNLPDLRGEFLRGLDDGRGVDSARALGSAQSHQVQDHEHPVVDVLSGNSFGTPYSPGGGTSLSASAGSFVTNSSTKAGVPNTGNHGSETRPRNVALLACIKY